MTPPRISTVHLAGAADLPTLLVGASLGTSVSALWRAAADAMSDCYQVVGWDLPGHGESPSPGAPFTIGELARSVIGILESQSNDAPIRYAGVSVTGAVGLRLLLDYPGRFASVALICTGARIGQPAEWVAKADVVQREGTRGLVDAARQRWFTPRFVGRDPATVARLLDSLCAVDPSGYASTCRALAQFDVRADLAAVADPVLAIAGSEDIATPPELLRDIASRVDGRYVELANTAHLPPADKPAELAAVLMSSARTTTS